MPRLCLFITLLCFCACKPARKVSTSFYYWKTVYRQNKTESNYLRSVGANKLYVRIMDIDLDEGGTNAIPVSAVTFQDKIPDTVQIVPVVYIVNNVLKNLSAQAMKLMAPKIVSFVNSKVKQAGKNGFDELQIDCDWTAETRDNYFYLLRQIKPFLAGKLLTVTLRLHQLKNQGSSGVPPADKVLLMCYNMGNLRKYGNQNSIIDVNELKKYLGNNVPGYALPIDVALPLFSWAVAFRDRQYIGIDKQINFNILNDEHKFTLKQHNIYVALTDMPRYGLKKNDELRWEDSPLADLNATAAYLSALLYTKKLNLIFFHLDETVIKKYSYGQLQDIGYLFR